MWGTDRRIRKNDGPIAPQGGWRTGSIRSNREDRPDNTKFRTSPSRRHTCASTGVSYEREVGHRRNRRWGSTDGSTHDPGTRGALDRGVK